MSPLPCVSPIPTTNTTTHGTHPRNHGNNGAGASTTMSSSSSSGDQLLCLPLQQRDVLNLPLFIASTLCYCYHKPHFVVSTYSHILSSHLALIISSRPYHLISPLSSHLTLAPISSSSSPVANAGRGGFDDELSALLGRTEVRQGCTIRVFCCGVVVVNILPVELPPPPPPFDLLSDQHTLSNCTLVSIYTSHPTSSFAGARIHQRRQRCDCREISRGLFALTQEGSIVCSTRCLSVPYRGNGSTYGWQGLGRGAAWRQGLAWGRKKTSPVRDGYRIRGWGWG